MVKKDVFILIAENQIARTNIFPRPIRQDPFRSVGILDHGTVFRARAEQIPLRQEQDVLILQAIHFLLGQGENVLIHQAGHTLLSQEEDPVPDPEDNVLLYQCASPPQQHLDQ